MDGLGLAADGEPEPVVSFADVALAYQRRAEELVRLGETGGPADLRFRELRRRFEARNGQFSDFTSTATRPGAVAVTVRPSRWSFLGEGKSAVYWRWTGLATRDAPDVAAQLQEGDALALKAERLLSGQARQLILLHVFSATSDLLLTVDTDLDRRAAVEAYRGRLREAESEFRRAAAQTAQYVYMAGALLGLALIALIGLGLGGLAAFLDVNAGQGEVGRAIGCAVAGMLGSVVSVMWRVTLGDFAVDHDAGRNILIRLGAVRPLIGGVFGLALYFALESGLVGLVPGASPNFYYFAFVAFLGGFSERLAPDLFGGAETDVRPKPGPRRQRT